MFYFRLLPHFFMQLGKLSAKLLPPIAGLLWVGLLSIGLVWSNMASAHALHAVAQFDGEKISGNVYYSDGTPAQESYVEVFEENQPTSALTSGKTNRQGFFSLPLSLPSRNQVSQNYSQGDILGYTVIAYGVEGHLVKTDVQPLFSSSSASSSALDRDEIALLRADIAKLHHHLWLHDIIGGVGYLVGILGLWAFVRSHKRRT